MIAAAPRSTPQHAASPPSTGSFRGPRVGRACNFVEHIERFRQAQVGRFVLACRIAGKRSAYSDISSFSKPRKMLSGARRAMVAAARKGAACARAMSSVPATMRAAVVRETGPVENMKVETDYPVPVLKPGQALVKNKFSGINFIDTYHRSGLYARELPFIGGQEGGGFVAATTPEAEAQAGTLI